MSDQISARVKNELVFMNLIESLQKLWVLLSPTPLFDPEDFLNASAGQLSLLYSKASDLVAQEAERQGVYEAELLVLKKQLYQELKGLEEEVKARKQAMIASENSRKEAVEAENEVFRLDEKIANVRGDLEGLVRTHEGLERRKTGLDGEIVLLKGVIEGKRATVEQLRETFGEAKGRKQRLEEGVKRKINENNELLLRIRGLEANLERVEAEKPALSDLGAKLQSELERIGFQSEDYNRKAEELGEVKARVETEVRVKEGQIKELSMRRNRLETIYAREGTLQQQLKLENEINTTLILENEVLLKQHEFMGDKSTSNSLIFLMNESLANRMSMQPADLMEDLGDRKGSDSKGRATVVGEIERELGEKRMLIESLKGQMKGAGGKEREMAAKIREIEELISAAEEELSVIRG